MVTKRTSGAGTSWSCSWPLLPPWAREELAVLSWVGEQLLAGSDGLDTAQIYWEIHGWEAGNCCRRSSQGVGIPQQALGSVLSSTPGKWFLVLPWTCTFKTTFNSLFITNGTPESEFQHTVTTQSTARPWACSCNTGIKTSALYVSSWILASKNPVLFCCWTK